MLAYPEHAHEAHLIKNAQTRFLPKSFAKLPMAINIFGDSVAHTLWEKPAITTVLTDKNIAEGYRSYFKLLWEHAESDRS